MCKSKTVRRFGNRVGYVKLKHRRRYLFFGEYVWLVVGNMYGRTHISYRDYDDALKIFEALASAIEMEESKVKYESHNR